MPKIGIFPLCLFFRRTNAELEKEYGSDVWKEHLKQFEAMQKFIEYRNSMTEKEIEGINKKRKF